MYTGPEIHQDADLIVFDEIQECNQALNALSDEEILQLGAYMRPTEQVQPAGRVTGQPAVNIAG